MLHLVLTGPAAGISFAPASEPQPAVAGRSSIGYAPVVVAAVSRASPFHTLLSLGDQLVAAGGVELTRASTAQALKVCSLIGARASPAAPYLITLLTSREAAVRARAAVTLAATARRQQSVRAPGGLGAAPGPPWCFSRPSLPLDTSMQAPARISSTRWYAELIAREAKGKLL